MEYFFLIAIIALLFYIKSGMDSKFRNLEEEYRNLARSIDALKKPEPGEIKKAPPVTAEPPKPVIREEPTAIVREHIPPPVAEKTPQPALVDFDQPYQKPPPRPVVPAKPYIPETSWWEQFKEKNPDLEKFIGENLINKIGILILVLGISYFVKFAIDKNWINEPARAGIGILSGALVMGVAHKLRVKYGAFSSVLVAGALSIFYFTIGIAFHDYHLFSQTVAFIIMVVITAFSCFISLSYNRKELAVLSLIGGFAVPFMVSTGQGNYAVLFSYILILDIGILTMAYYRKWTIINILSYIFTVILFSAWLFQVINEPKPPYLGALIFAFAFYFLFILINIINNLRTKGAFNAIELSILGSNTFLFYGAGMVILENYHPEFKGLFTTLLALMNLVYAWFLYKKFGLDKSAVYLLIGLTMTFVTLAIPIQFEGNYITLFWAGEGVLLIWLSQKSGVISYKFGAVVVNVLMIVSLIMDWGHYFGADKHMIILNPIFITGLVAVASLIAINKLLLKENDNSEQFGLSFNPAGYRKRALLAAVIISYFVGILEVGYQAGVHIAYPSNNAFPALFHLVFFAVVCHFLWKSEHLLQLRMAFWIAIVNIVLYITWFSGYPFREHMQTIYSGEYNNVAFWLHYVLLAVAAYYIFGLYKNSRSPSAPKMLKNSIFTWLGAFVVIVIASSELMLHFQVMAATPETNYSVRNQVIRTGFPILWGALAFLFLIIGIKRQNKDIRIIALTLLGLTILKLFVFDIRNASETGKIIAFILLGVLILVISFVYQKLKVLVLEDKPVSNESE